MEQSITASVLRRGKKFILRGLARISSGLGPRTRFLAVRTTMGIGVGIIFYAPLLFTQEDLWVRVTYCLSTLCNCLADFRLQKRLTFKSRGTSRPLVLRERVTYFLVRLAIAGVAFLTGDIGLHQELGLPLILATILVMLAFWPISYFLCERIFLQAIKKDQ